MNSRTAVAGTKKLYAAYPSRHLATRTSSSYNIHESAGNKSGAVPRSSGNPESSRDTFHSLVRNFFMDPIFCSLHRKSYPRFTSLALHSLNASAPCRRITGYGSMELPRLLLIFRPLSSRPYPIIHAFRQGARPVSRPHLSKV